MIISLCLNQQDLLDESTEYENSFFFFPSLGEDSKKSFERLLDARPVDECNQGEKKPGQIEQKKAP